MNEPHPTSPEPPVKDPYLIRVRHGRPVPARKDGHYYVCAYPVFLGLWWSPREVRVLEHDPHRDFYREQRQAQEAINGDTAPDARPVASTDTVTTKADASADVPAWERVDTPCPRPPVPPTVRSARYAPRLEWGR